LDDISGGAAFSSFFLRRRGPEGMAEVMHFITRVGRRGKKKLKDRWIGIGAARDLASMPTLRRD